MQKKELFTFDNFSYEKLWFSLEQYKSDFKTFGKPFLEVVPNKWKNEFKTVEEMYETIMLDLQHNVNIYFNGFFEHVDLIQLPKNIQKLIQYALYHSFASKLYGVLFTNKNIKTSFSTSSGYSIAQELTRNNGSYLDLFTPEALQSLNTTSIKQLMASHNNDWKTTLILLGELNYDAIYTCDEIDKILEILKIENENMITIIGNWVEECLQTFTDELTKDNDFVEKFVDIAAKNPKLKGDKGDKGDVGIQGLAGSQGPIGPVGAKGDKGDVDTVSDPIEPKNAANKKYVDENNFWETDTTKTVVKLKDKYKTLITPFNICTKDGKALMSVNEDFKLTSKENTEDFNYNPTTGKLTYKKQPEMITDNQEIINKVYVDNQLKRLIPIPVELKVIDNHQIRMELQEEFNFAWINATYRKKQEAEEEEKDDIFTFNALINRQQFVQYETAVSIQAFSKKGKSSKVDIQYDEKNKTILIYPDDMKEIITTPGIKASLSYYTPKNI